MSTVSIKASRFVIAAYLFGSKIAEDQDIDDVPFASDVHIIIAKYLKSKKLLEERVQPAELFEFFDENTPEYDELCRILDYSDGEKLSGEVAEKYFYDCVRKLKLDDVDNQISTLKTSIEVETDLMQKKALALGLQKLIKLKEKLRQDR
jgi:hypothetical protein